MAKGNRVVYAHMQNDAFTVLTQLASLHGIHPNVLASRYIEEGLENDQMGSGLDSKEHRLFRMARQVARQKQAKNSLLTIAKSLMSNPDEKMADTFHLLCEEFEFDVKEIMQEASVTAEDILLSFDTNSRTEEAMAFLFRIFRPTVGKAMKEIPANVVRMEAKRMGITETSLKAAKKAMGIESIRRSLVWTWSLPTPYSIPRGKDILKEDDEKPKRKSEKASKKVEVDSEDK